jgi:hypothetical protein
MHRNNVVAPVPIVPNHGNTPALLDLEEDPPFVSFTRPRSRKEPPCNMRRWHVEDTHLDWLGVPLQNTLILGSCPTKHSYLNTEQAPQVFGNYHPMFGSFPRQDRQLILVPDPAGNAASAGVDWADLDLVQL